MKNPIITIGVPTYNRPKTLIRTLNSLLEQTYSNLEIIVSDNCSTDEEVEKVMTQFSLDARIKYYRQSQNRGVFFNFNFILEKATGEYFMRVADDDWLDKNYIKSCYEFLIENSEYSSAYGTAKIYNLKNELISYDAKIDLSQSSGSERVKNYFQHVGYNSCFYGLMRRNYMPLLELRNQIADDWLIVARIAFAGKIKLIQNTNCHISEGGVSNSIDSLTKSFGSSLFTQVFFYFTISLNILRDILWTSKVYRSASIFNRIRLATTSFMVIYKRFNLKKEIRRGIITYTKIKSSRFKKKFATLFDR